MLLFCVILYPVFYKGLECIPAWVDDPIVFDGEALYMANGDKIQDLWEVVVAEPDVVPKVNPKSDPASKENGPLGEDIGEKQSIVPENVWDRFFYVLENTKGLNALTSGRIDIYKAYMSKLNYSGHRSVSLVVGGHKKAHAHNNWLQFGYTYGILGMLFYAVITVLAIGFSLKFYLTKRRKNATYAFLIPAIMVGFVVATIAECLFLPFEVFPAFAFWFAFGDLFVKKVPKNKFLQELEDIN